MVRLSYPLRIQILIYCRLIAVNAISLICALGANLSLLLNMARRLRFNIAQPITIGGFYLAGILLIALVSVAGGGHLHAAGVQDQALTQAYYYGIFAAGLYMIISSLLVYTAWGALKGHYSHEFKLTISQRTLMLQTIAYMVYLLLGALIYSKIEGWMFSDSVYFVNFTLLTVGIGDYSPMTHAGRSFLFPFAIGGIVILGLVIGSIRSLVLDRGKEKIAARNFEKTRKAVLKRLSKGKRSLPVHRRVFSKRIQEEEPNFKLSPHGDRHTERKRREAEFHIMREIQSMSDVEGKWVALLLSSLSWFFLWFIGAVVFWKAEKNQDWSYFEAVYFSYTSLLTIGYGDFYPMSNSGKPFFVLWSLLAVPTLTILISDMGDTVVKGIKDLTLILGELTVLPGEKGSVRDRIKVGISKITGGRFTVGKHAQEAGKRVDEAEAKTDEEYGGIEERPPGMPREPKKPGEGDNRDNRHRDGAMVERIAGDFENEEAEEATEAHERGDEEAADEHTYRYHLVREIKKVYSDLGAQPPKKYTYEEWCHFLELLGEDESSSKYHREAPIDTPNNTTGTAEMEGAVPIDGEKSGGKQEIRDWSWVGNRSPLMGGKDEAEWVLERLVGKLESELKGASRKYREERKKAQEEETNGSRSSGTLQDHS